MTHIALNIVGGVAANYITDKSQIFLSQIFQPQILEMSTPTAPIIPPEPYMRDLGDTLNQYHRFMVGSFDIGYLYLLRKLLKMRHSTMGKLDVEEYAKLKVTTTSLSLWSFDMLCDKLSLPKNPFTKE